MVCILIRARPDLSIKLGITCPLSLKNMHYLVIGGNGFLGKSICSFLLEKKDARISIFDVVLGDVDERVTAIKGDITDFDQVEAALKGIDVVFHTASPIHGKPAAIYHKVNVVGSQNILKACQESLTVKKLIFTSSAGVVYNGQDLYNVDETLGYCQVHMDAYNETKAIAEELILAGNGKNLLTCAIRPSGIFGPRYRYP
jgi:sterol-4alpha-carboxylate 3-dehydrogenase (decarboxylating)